MLKVSILKEDAEKVKKLMGKQNGNISKEIKKKTKKKPERNSGTIITIMKNSLEEFNGRSELAEERISGLEDSTMEIIKSEQHKEKRLSLRKRRERKRERENT